MVSVECRRKHRGINVGAYYDPPLRKLRMVASSADIMLSDDFDRGHTNGSIGFYALFVHVL